jgi:hypothetical protein
MIIAKIKRAFNNIPVLVWIIIALSFILRLAVAITYPFQADELYDLLGAKAIFQYGVPRMPSGIIWPEGGFLLYLEAPLVNCFGYVEGIVRLPGVFLSTLGLFFFFKLGRKLFDTDTAIIATAAWAFDMDSVLWGVYTRAYCLTPFLLLLTIYFWRELASDIRDRKKLIFAAASYFIAIWVHPLFLLFVPGVFIVYLMNVKKFTKNNLIIPVLIIVMGGIFITVLTFINDPGLFSSTNQAGGFLKIQNLLSNISHTLSMNLLNRPLFLFSLKYFLPTIILLSVVKYKKTVKVEDFNNLLSILFFTCCSFLLLCLFRWSQPGYILPLFPPFYLLASFGLVKVSKGFFNQVMLDGTQSANDHESKIAKNGAFNKFFNPVIFILLILFLNQKFLVKEYWKLMHSHSSGGLKEAYQYVRGHWQENDIYLDSNPSALIYSGKGAKFYHFTQLDFRVIAVNSKNGIINRIMGDPIISKVSDLENILQENKRAWLVLLDGEFERNLSSDGQQLILTRMKPVFRLDETTVYLKQ